MTFIKTSILEAPSTRRQILSQGVAATLVYGLAQTLWTHDLFAAPQSEAFNQWITKLIAAGDLLRTGQITTEIWQEKNDALYGAVSLEELRAHIDFKK